MFTHGITIYNKYSSGRLDVWNRTYIEGVHWENVSGIKLGGKSIMTDNSTEIVIPKFDGFRLPKEYGRQSPTGAWTLAQGDYVVLGNLDLEITDGSDLADYDNVRVIKSYDVVDYALNPMLNNITVVAQ